MFLEKLWVVLIGQVFSSFSGPLQIARATSPICVGSWQLLTTWVRASNFVQVTEAVGTKPFGWVSCGSQSLLATRYFLCAVLFVSVL